MANKYCFEALDKTFKNIMLTKAEENNNKLFSGLTIILGGDVRQILPVVPKRRKSDTIEI